MEDASMNGVFPEQRTDSVADCYCHQRGNDRPEERRQLLLLEKIEKADAGEIESEIAKIVKEKPGLSIGAYMGLIMQKFKGRISGKEVNAILQKLLG